MNDHQFVDTTSTGRRFTLVLGACTWAPTMTTRDYPHVYIPQCMNPSHPLSLTCYGVRYSKQWETMLSLCMVRFEKLVYPTHIADSRLKQFGHSITLDNSNSAYYTSDFRSIRTIVLVIFATLIWIIFLLRKFHACLIFSLLSIAGQST